MPTHTTSRLVSQYEVGNEEVARKLRALLSRIGALRDLAKEEEGDDTPQEAMPNLPALREGLRDLEQMACTLLYELIAGDEQLLPELPDIPLTEALSQLVEGTAESLSISSRISFSGRERPLPDYLSRLLYKVAQEALGRVAGHQGAHRLRFSLDYRRGEVFMSIEDDGVPGDEDRIFLGADEETLAFPPFLAGDAAEHTQMPDGDGQFMRRLRSMVENRGGSLTINSGVEQGVQLQLQLPYQAPERREIPQPVPPPAPDVPATSPRLKILIVDGQAVSRAGLRRLLESYVDLEVVGEAGDSVQAISETAELLPQVVLINAQLPDGQALEILRQVRQLNPEIHVLLLSSEENEDQLYEALRAGVNGYVLTNIAPDELAQAVRIVAHGEVLVQPQLAARLLARAGEQERNKNGTSLQESLTAREQEVLQLLARGLRNKEIAARLFVSERTVNFHLANIYAKLQVSGRTEALSRALEQGLLKV
ncbi:MAG TPA: LuxR C-terminal-related transcriptional regulator [Ktedonobacteraceae bacterium]|nr:LuxR C-terminal-related transcriptional regulator [Ktedonobacteraceae bacterium]